MSEGNEQIAEVAASALAVLESAGSPALARWSARTAERARLWACQVERLLRGRTESSQAAFDADEAVRLFRQRRLAEGAGLLALSELRTGTELRHAIRTLLKTMLLSVHLPGRLGPWVHAAYLCKGGPGQEALDSDLKAKQQAAALILALPSASFDPTQAAAFFASAALIQDLASNINLRQEWANHLASPSCSLSDVQSFALATLCALRNCGADPSQISVDSNARLSLAKTGAWGAALLASDSFDSQVWQINRALLGQLSRESRTFATAHLSHIVESAQSQLLLLGRVQPEDLKAFCASAPWLRAMAQQVLHASKSPLAVDLRRIVNEAVSTQSLGQN